MRAQSLHHETAAQTRRIRDYFGRYRGAFGAGFAALLLTNLLALALPWLAKTAIDALQAGDEAGLAVARKAALGIAGSAALMAVVRTVSRTLIFNSGRRVEHDLRSELFEHLCGLPPGWFQEMSVGDVMSRAVHDLGQVRLLLGPGVLNLINTSVAYTVGLTLMVGIDPWLTLAALAPYPVILFMMRAIASRLYERSRRVQEGLGEISAFLQERLAGQQVIKSYVRERASEEAFRVENDDFLGRSLALAKLRGIMVPIFGLAGSVGTLVVLWFGGRRVIAGELSLGSLVAFQGYLAYLGWPTLALGWMLSIWQRGSAAMRRLNEIFESLPSVRDEGAEWVEGLRGGLEARDLTFTYPDGDAPALTGVRFQVEPGQRLGIVGLTGAGKSTLVDLIPRLKDLPRGQLFLDGHDVCALPLAQLRSVVGYAPQDPFLFSDTLRSNIAFARPTASDAEIEAAARLAAVHDDIASFPAGYDTIVGERGVTLSGGQRQRVALARAILKEPALLVLDDSLSSVDAETEARILEGLETVMSGRTAIIVSHRIAAVRGCDLILVLEEGEVVACGSHEALAEAPGLYADLWRRQRLEAALEAQGESEDAA